jgi:hypothetical protein
VLLQYLSALGVVPALHLISPGALLSGQETLPFEEWNLASLRLRNHHLTMNHRTEPHAAENLIEENHKSGHESSLHSCELVGLLPTERPTSMKTMISTAHGMADAVAAVEPVTEEVSQTPVLITEQEVVFSTVAAVPVRRTNTRRALIAVLRGIFVNPTTNAERPRRHYPPRRNSLLEHTAMAREMQRL